MERDVVNEFYTVSLPISAAIKSETNHPKKEVTSYKENLTNGVKQHLCLRNGIICRLKIVLHIKHFLVCHIGLFAVYSLTSGKSSVDYSLKQMYM